MMQSTENHCFPGTAEKCCEKWIYYILFLQISFQNPMCILHLTPFEIATFQVFNSLNSSGQHDASNYLIFWIYFY